MPPHPPVSRTAPVPVATAPSPLRIALALLLASALGCDLDERPQPPTVLRDTSMLDDELRFIHPFVPGHRTTADGRIAMQVQGSHRPPLWVFAPEKLDGPILPGPAGPEILATTDPYAVTLPAELDEYSGTGHQAICDSPTSGPDGRPNPYACGPDGTHDCYDFTIVKTTTNGISAQFWGIPTHVEVANPKTPEARIVDASTGDAVKGSVLPLSGDWTEPAVTFDGRLLTGRTGAIPRFWRNPETGEGKVRAYDIGYYVLPESAEPCDVTGWTDFMPMSHAPFDPLMKGRYGIAAYPFRDSEGNPIEDGEEMGGTYPWVDREGSNLFMAAVPGRISEQSEEKFPRRCVTPGCEQWEETVDWDRGYLVGGLWTHGKLVHLDAMINNQDWAVPVTPAGHWWVSLYRDAEGADVEVRLGGGREAFGPRPRPPGFAANANILDSIQHLENHQVNALTVTPRDVVWVMGTGLATDEVVFDDYLDPDAFIVSSMQGSVTQKRGDRGATLAVPEYWNGQKRTLVTPIRYAPFNVLLPEQDEEVHLQNGATSLGWNVPPYGLVAAGTGRVEPTALGGIKGKGFWLDGTDVIRYAVPEQPRPVTDVDWYVGIFLDSRAADGEARSLARFPDGTALHLSGRTVLYVDGEEILRSVELPSGGPGAGWFHVGLRLTDGNRSVTLLADGFPLDRWQAPRPVFTMVPGELVVGQHGATPGFEGWIDELKVLAHDVNPEVACNHAHGTLVRVAEGSRLADAAARYPAWAHEDVAEAAGEGARAGRYACHHDYSGDYRAHLANLPAGSVSVRGSINFPEGPLRHGEPRPDSTANPFCLHCHHANGQGGLSLDALALRPGVPAEHDPRRQPHQPPARVFGNVPGGWIAPGAGSGSPAASFQAPPDGALVDRWLLPGPGDARASGNAAASVHRH